MVNGQLDKANNEMIRSQIHYSPLTVDFKIFPALLKHK
jgi:hypothetical protein